ncbi:Uncharacterised protein [Fusobacterium necrophorum subsp. necrophorum]|nr:Uncharacterised protein [Fusobacterium necrophorum subsp. necrophorum]
MGRSGRNLLEVLRLSLQKQKNSGNRRCCRRRTSGKEVISKYESLYLALQSENFALFGRAVESMEDTLEEIQKKHQISREYLWEKRRLRSI